MASETGRAQTLQVFVCLQIDTANRPMLVGGCDFTHDQARELKFTSGIWFVINSYYWVSKVKNIALLAE